MADTITNLIHTIDITFPIAGQDNDSQGFRDNFNIIQQSLLSVQNEVSLISNTVSGIGSLNYTTATHLVALEDVTIGTSTNVVLSVTDMGVVATQDGSSAVLVGLEEHTTAIVAYALTEPVTQTTGTVFAVVDASHIMVGATTVINSTSYTVTAIDYTTDYITVNHSFPIGSFAVGDTLTFANPYVTPTGNFYLNGDISVTGNITAFSGSPSDAKFKENVATITGALATVNQLRGVTYDWTEQYLSNLKLVGLAKQDTGVIAQETQSVFPVVVHPKADGSLTVNYEKFAGLFIEAIKELTQTVSDLQNQINELKGQTNSSSL